MAHTVFCVEAKKELPGLDEPPFDNELGRKVYDNVSEPALREMWVEALQDVVERIPAESRRGAKIREVIVKQMDDSIFLATAPAVCLAEYAAAYPKIVFREFANREAPAKAKPPRGLLLTFLGEQRRTPDC